MVADRKAYFAAPDWLAEDEIAACQLRAHVR